MNERRVLVIRLKCAIVCNPDYDAVIPGMIERDAPQGFSIFEGVAGIVHYDPAGSTYDCQGTYRPLTDGEWTRLREGSTPWDV